MQTYNGAVTAVATVFIGVFTCVLARVTRRQGKLTEGAVKAASRSADIAEKALTDLERPYLYILCDGTFAYEGESLYVGYDVVNHGKSAAIVEDVVDNLAPSHTGEPEAGLHFEYTHPLSLRRVLGPGEHRHAIRVKPPGNLGIRKLPSGEFTIETTDDVFLSIQILYRGPFTKGHETRATWRLEGLSNRFVEAFPEDEEYNCVK
ncbi:MAG TPA: hypothetical protein VMU82_00470 [Acetobacteraceae bacterium]|nr:hypothetical protein [Acetobacteraceae bacterium]